MDSEELRRACERAGLKSDSRGVLLPGGGGHFLDWGHPALPAYAASLLVAMVRELLGPTQWQHRLHMELNALTDYGWTCAATDEQRIRAAMEVLGDE